MSYQTVVNYGALLSALSQIIPHCYDGYRLASTTSLACQANGQWMGQPTECNKITCPSLSVENGTFKPISINYAYRTVITLTCSSGYEAEHGRTQLTCQHDGTWGLASLKCIKIRCNDTSDVQHDVVLWYPLLAFGEVGKAVYNSTYFNYKTGSLQVNCSYDRKLFWINKPVFGEHVKMFY